MGDSLLISSKNGYLEIVKHLIEVGKTEREQISFLSKEKQILTEEKKEENIENNVTNIIKEEEIIFKDDLDFSNILPNKLADPNYNNMGKTALYNASKYGHYEIG